MAKSKAQKRYLDYKGKKLPVKIYVERRSNIRFSIARKSAIMRVPYGIPKAEYEKQYKRFKEWIIAEFDRVPELRQRFFGNEYQDGDVFKMMDKEFKISIQHVDRKSHHAILKENTVVFSLSQYEERAFNQKAIKTLLSRVMGNHFLPEIERRVDKFNEQYFQERIENIRLKNNQSNWGSCSHNRNLNFSTRLLFAPSDVIDYVVVHELAHLKEMNHSPRFWKWVSDVMPNYQEKEKWLSENGHLCFF